MKKTLASLLLIAAIILIIWIFETNSTNSLPPYVSIISGDQSNSYSGSAYYTDNNGPTIPIDLKTISGLTQAEASSTQKNFYVTADGLYALFWGMPFGQGAGINMIDVKKRVAEYFLFPETPAYAVDYIWQGDNLVLHYYSANGLVAGEGLNISSPRQDHYYSFDPINKKFSPISVDDATSQYTTKTYNVYFSKESDNSKNFVVSRESINSRNGSTCGLDAKKNTVQ